jgi:hypothetical protein
MALLARCAAAAALFLLGGLSHAAEAIGVGLNAATRLRFASVEEGRAVLGNADAFSAALSAFDRSARTNVAHRVSAEAFLRFASDQAQGWSDAEMRRLMGVVEPIGRLMYDRGLSFPATVLLVKSSGFEEGHAPHTRGNAIVLPAASLALPDDTLHEIVLHELFHVLTGSNPPLKEALYRTIGFSACGELRLPPGLAARKITNPDAPGLGHCASVGRGAAARIVFPVLIASQERYDPARKSGLVQYIALDLILAEWRDGEWWPAHVDGVLPRLDAQQFDSFMEQIGRNSAASAHPEEILADNFVLMVKGARKVPTPWVLAAMDRVLGWSQ